MGFMDEPAGLVEVLKQVLQTSGQRGILLTYGHPPLDSIIMATALREAGGQEDCPSSTRPCSKLSEGLTLFDERLFCYSGYA